MGSSRLECKRAGCRAKAAAGSEYCKGHRDAIIAQRKSLKKKAARKKPAMKR